jgi:hypothetical protein
MKRRDIKQLALLGLTSGLLLASKQAAQANQPSDQSSELLLAANQKAKCPNKVGCPSVTAVRDQNRGSKQIAYQDPSSGSTDLSTNKFDPSDPNSGNVGYHLMTKDELLLELSDDGAKMFNSLTPEEQKLALQVASMRCAKTNPCAGLNACATETNDCAGHGKCKATGKCAISDKNLAVKLVYDKMAAKRKGALNGNR